MWSVKIRTIITSGILIVLHCTAELGKAHGESTASKYPAADPVFRDAYDSADRKDKAETAVVPVAAVRDVYNNVVEPFKQKVIQEHVPTVQIYVDSYLVKLEVKADVDRVVAAWDETPAATTCAVMRALTVSLSQVLHFFFSRSSSHPPRYQNVLVHWLDEFVCATPPDLGPAAAVFFFSLVMPSMLLRPRWVILASVAFALLATTTATALTDALGESSSGGFLVAWIAAVHIGCAAGLLLAIVALIGSVFAASLGIFYVLLATGMVLLFGSPSFWFFVFSPVFFITRLTLFNPFTALPGILFLVFSGRKYARGLLQAFIIRAAQPFVRTAVFLYMIVKAAWAGRPSDAFPQFKWMWRFHAVVWAAAIWAPTWMLGNALYGLQLAWALLVLDLAARGVGSSLSSNLSGSQCVFLMIRVGLLVSTGYAALKLAIKGGRWAVAWRTKQLAQEEEKRKMIEELGYVPLNAKDLAKNPQLLQQQFQQRVAAKDKLRKRR